MVDDLPPPSPRDPDHDPGRSSGSAFADRLARAREASTGRSRKGLNESGAFGMATRLVAELISGLVVGGGIGWLVDRWLGTKPWFLVVFFILGAVAGLLNVMRTARDLNARAERRRQELEDQVPDQSEDRSGGRDTDKTR
ncbi:MAG: AtpZ/AtpI family protein [Sphingomonadales bacterium]